jgi:hypothetical protein
MSVAIEEWGNRSSEKVSLHGIYPGVILQIFSMDNMLFNSLVLLKILSTGQEKFPARNSIYGHVQYFMVLVAIIKAFIPQSLNKQ